MAVAMVVRRRSHSAFASPSYGVVKLFSRFFFFALRLRLPKPPIPASLSSFVVVSASATSPNGTVLKRKRPARLDIPVSSLAFGILPTPSAAAPRDVVEEERDAFSIYCKKGRREHMKDRYSTAITYADNKNCCGSAPLLLGGAELLLLCLSCGGAAPPILLLLFSSQHCSSSSQAFYNLLISSRHAFVIMY
ncbi:probable protein phosphatase 2C 25 [Arachis duranensis]|uniref:Probable protein phosphatase 2C 25 n=1 Tax=Arachis duranensis TaxID=130453 RepID=A0A9C6WJD2_ARADU|nr:probable protein phosphatase 2C 25 [Arachis duranensis]